MLEQHGRELPGNLLGRLRRDSALGERSFQNGLHVRQAKPQFELGAKVTAELGADQHPDARTIEFLLVVARIPQRLVGRLEQHELQRVGLLDLLGRQLVRAPVVVEVGDVSTQDRRRAVSADDTRLVAHVGPPPAGRRGTFRISPAGDQFPELGRMRGVRKNAAGADDRHGLTLGIRGGRLLLRWPVLHQQRGAAVLGELFQHHVHIQAANAERVHGCPPRQSVRLPGPGSHLARNEERRAVPIDLGVQLADVDRRHEAAVLQAQHGLDEARHAGRFQRVADVCLDAGDRYFLARRKLGAQDLAQGIQLRGIAQGRRSRVRLDVLQRGHVEPIPIGPLHGLDLAFLARRPEALAAAIGRDSQTEHERLNRIAVGQGSRQRLEHQRHVTFAADQSVGAGVERPRAGLTHTLGVREEHQRVALAVGRSADNRHVDPTQLQRAGRQQHRVQGRGTCRVDPQERTRKPESLRDRAGNHVDRQVGRVRGQRGHFGPHGSHQLSNDLVLKLRRELPEAVDFAEELRGFVNARVIDDIAGQIASLRMTDVHACIAKRNVEGVQLRVTQRFAGRLAHQQMSVIDATLQPRRNRTGLAIELAAVDDRAQLRIALAARTTLGMIVQFLIQALVRQLHHGAAAVAEHIPELTQIVGARQTAGHAGDGDRDARMLEPVVHAR